LFYNYCMVDLLDTLAVLSAHMGLEPDMDECGVPTASQAESQCSTGRGELDHGMVFRPAGGPCKALLKTLLTSACERDCFYCPFRAGRDFCRATLKPEEMADSFLTMHRAGTVDGIFLSSGVAGGGVRTQDRLNDTAEIIRNRRKFGGYLHLKIMPGAEKDQILQAMLLADRVSINLEAPNDTRLGMLAPHKTFLDELLRPLKLAEEIRKTRLPYDAWRRKWPSLTTQFVVGGAGETDLELLSTTQFLFRELHLARVYYSAFNPVKDTPLEDRPPENPLRQQRLYQASFLLRDYGFDVEELPLSGNGTLPLDQDPKQAWASQYLRESPVEVNRAEQSQLLRVPGIGPKTVARLVTARGNHRITALEELRGLGVNLHRAGPYLLLDGQQISYQPTLW